MIVVVKSREGERGERNVGWNERKEKWEARTQHGDEFLDQSSRGVIIDMVCDVSDPHDIVTTLLDIGDEVGTLI